VAESVTAEAAERIEDLARWGTPFDRDAAGHYVLSREAAHSTSRVVRVEGDRAGAAIMQALIAEVRNTPSIRVVEGITAVDLARSDGRVVGVFCRKLGDRYLEPISVRAAPQCSRPAGSAASMPSPPIRPVCAVTPWAWRRAEAR
jgi:L-aspartate oxidase